MELILKDINVCEYNKIINTSCSAEADIIVPDTKPDIRKILCVNAGADLLEYYIKKEKLVISGDVKFTIMYVGDNSKNTIYTIDCKVPFNHQTDISDARDDYTCTVSCRVSSTDFKLKNSRKLTAGATISVAGQVVRQSLVKALEKPDGDDAVPFRQAMVKTDSLVTQKELKFDITDSLSLPEREDIGEIYDFSVGINVSEVKLVNNKAIIKGTLPAKVFYLSGTSLSNYETEFSFTQIADLDMVSPQSILSADFSVVASEYELTGENDSLLEVNIIAKAIVKAFESTEYFLTKDIYSPDFKYTLTGVKSNLTKYTSLPSAQITIKDIIGSNGEDGDILKVHYMKVYPMPQKAFYKGSNLVASGNINVTVIYSNHLDELCSLRKSIPYSAELSANPDLQNADFDVRVSCVNYGYVLSSDKDIQIRCVLRFESDAYTKSVQNLITDFSVDKNNPIDKSSQPGVVVCYPCGGLSMWDYARKYNTTCEEIASANNLDPSEDLPSDRAILIPKRQKADPGI